MIQDTVKDKMDAVRGLSSSDILAALGLERRRSVLDVLLPAVGVFAAGAVLGGGIALLLAPKSGRETRRELKGKASELTHRLGESAGELAGEVRGAVAQKAEEAGIGSGSSSRSHENGTRERKSEDAAHRAMSGGHAAK
jgi:gas vesicle protein